VNVQSSQLLYQRRLSVGTAVKIIVWTNRYWN